MKSKKSSKAESPVKLGLDELLDREELSYPELQAVLARLERAEASLVSMRDFLDAAHYSKQEIDDESLQETLESIANTTKEVDLSWLSARFEPGTIPSTTYPYTVSSSQQLPPRPPSPPSSPQSSQIDLQRALLNMLSQDLSPTDDDKLQTSAKRRRKDEEGD